MFPVYYAPNDYRTVGYRACYFGGKFSIQTGNMYLAETSSTLSVNISHRYLTVKIIIFTYTSVSYVYQIYVKLKVYM